jgi:hypothetical protein
MAKLWELARLVRSKNAGPFVLTFDVMFEDEAQYRRVRDAGVLSAARVAGLYGVPADQVRFFHCDNARAIKFSIPRAVASGELRDGDVFGGQQYAPLLDLEVP